MSSVNEMVTLCSDALTSSILKLYACLPAASPMRKYAACEGESVFSNPAMSLHRVSVRSSLLSSHPSCSTSKSTPSFLSLWLIRLMIRLPASSSSLFIAPQLVHPCFMSCIAVTEIQSGVMYAVLELSAT